jgi:hypothetical protein
VVSCEPDLYGFSTWLAEHLGCQRQINARGYQHGWIWWDRDPGDFRGLDPGFSKVDGCLVQNEQIAESLRSEGIYAKAVGLPFLTYKNYSGQPVPERQSEVLFVPTHSNPWNDVKSDVVDSMNQHRDKGWSILLSATDSVIGAPGFKNIEIGAGVFVKESFQRLFRIFHSYEYMVTDCMGSHICYGLACGMKVGIDLKNYNRHQTALTQTPDYKRALTMTGKDISSVDFISNRFDGIFIEDSLPTYNKPYEVANEPPRVIATELGWKLD